VTPLVLDIVVKATLLLAAAAGVDAALRRTGSAAARHLTWAIAIAALLVLPIASATVPHWSVRIPVPPAIAAAQSPAPAAVPASTPSNWVRTQLSVPDSVSHPAASTQSSEVSTQRTALALALLYVSGLLLLLGRLGLEPFALRRLVRASGELTHDEWQSRLDASARDMGIAQPVRLLQSAQEVMPLTFGTVRPTIVLPASADEWTDDRRDAVLLHELAHVARRDCLVQRLAAFACALYWPHPGVWWAARRLRMERELACDDRVLAAGTGAREYAGHLLDLAHSLGSAPAPATALGMARARQLETRLLAVLDTARNRSTIRPHGRAIAVVIAMALLLPFAAVRAAVVQHDLSGPALSGPAHAPAEQATAATPSAAQAQSPDLVGTWELRLSRDPGMAQVTVRTEHGTHGRSVRMAQLPITAEQISAPSANVAFPIQREAGTFHVEGICRSGVCAGTYSFEPNQSFGAELAKRGLARPTPQQQMDLALADVGIAFLDELTKNGYARPELTDLVRAAQHGVDTGYLREMAALGYRVGTVDALVHLRDHGVDPNYVRGMADNGFARLSVDELLTARDHGVDPAYVKGMRDLGFHRDDIASLVSTRDHGIDPSYIRGMQDHGYRLTLEELTRTRDHGVDPAYVDGLSSLGYKGLTVDSLLRARDHGVDPAYIRGMADVGYKEVPLDALIRMRDHGVDPAFVRRVQQSGLGHLSVDQLIERRDHGMNDPDAAARAVVSNVRSLWRSVVAWMQS
jgi:beta-lactamase regulating signal transducer with metallopeptidase domain